MNMAGIDTTRRIRMTQKAKRRDIIMSSKVIMKRVTQNEIVMNTREPEKMKVIIESKGMTMIEEDAETMMITENIERMSMMTLEDTEEVTIVKGKMAIRKGGGMMMKTVTWKEATNATQREGGLHQLDEVIKRMRN